MHHGPYGAAEWELEAQPVMSWYADLGLFDATEVAHDALVQTTHRPRRRGRKKHSPTACMNQEASHKVC